MFTTVGIEDLAVHFFQRFVGPGSDPAAIVEHGDGDVFLRPKSDGIHVDIAAAAGGDAERALPAHARQRDAVDGADLAFQHPVAASAGEVLTRGHIGAGQSGE